MSNTKQQNQPDPVEMLYIELAEQNYWQLWLRAYSHACGLFSVTGGAVRLVITQPIIIIDKVFGSWKPVIFSTFMTYKPNLHKSIITQIDSSVKCSLANHNKKGMGVV